MYGPPMLRENKYCIIHVYTLDLLHLFHTAFYLLSESFCEYLLKLKLSII